MRFGPLIDYALISDAMRFYEIMGYKPVEVPWAVPQKVSDITCANDDLAFQIKPLPTQDEKKDVLIGSAEQGLIHQVMAGAIPYGVPVVSCSPCFRRGNDSPIHFEQFMKVEMGLAQSYSALKKMVEQPISDRGENDLHNIIRYTEMQFVHHAHSFMASKTTKDIERVETDEGIDLVIDGIEVGSYGFRPLTIIDPKSDKIHAFVWFYGTGLALPRFTQVQRLMP